MNLKKDFSNREDIFTKARKEFHCSRKQFRGVLSDIRRRGWGIPKTKQKETDTQPTVIYKIGINIEQFRKKHDIFHIVGEAAKKLKKDIFLTESEFVQSNGIRMVGYRDALNLPENASYRGKAGSTIYWSHPETIAQMKKEGTLL
jgi:hypothetical protein